MIITREFNSITEVRAYLRAIQDMKDKNLLHVDVSPTISIMSGCVELKLEVTPHEKV